MIIKMLGIITISLLLCGCTVFEAVNSAYPLPDDYGKEARSMGKPLGMETHKQQIDPDKGLKTATFSEWHNEQYASPSPH